ncbi:MAG: polysaccharide deacetylase family protein [Nitriliruptorales bacterium]|nr:polysaccharide deacetylase family protein [Nitriliruptorales bacterium]
MGSNSPSMISRGEFGAAAIPRILGLLERSDARATFCIPGHTVYAYPDLVRRIRDAGHELGHHGWVHENPQKFDRDGERRNLERGFEAFDKVVGVRPRGYRSPAWDFSENTVDLLLEFGFDYDSSCMGSDVYPYYLRQGDKVSPTEPYVFGEPTNLVEVPVTWGLDDFPPFEFVWGTNPGLTSPSDIEEIWRGDFDYAYEHSPGSVYALTMHPQVIGRGHRMLMLERLVNHIGDHDGTVFETIGAYVDRWRADNPLDRWKAEHPAYATPGTRAAG